MSVPPAPWLSGPPHTPRASGVGAQWLEPLRCWVQALMRALQHDPAVVRIALATVRGSAPREPGAGMLVAASGIQGTIGGGQLEWEALAAAHALLEERAVPALMQRIVLGADRGQCCGGVVEVWMERYARADLGLLEAANLAAGRGAAVLMSTIGPTGVERRILCDGGADTETDQLLRAPDARAIPRIRRNAAGEATLLERLDNVLPPLWLYGAGHVGQALARILTQLPLRLTWIDSRAEQFPAQIPAAVQVLHSADPVTSVAAAPAGARFLVMTHSHPLDYALCRAILTRGDFAWAGLIGSKSKAARFRSRLARDGLAGEAVARLICPIGIGGIASKWPAAIAVGVAAQVMQDIGAPGEGTACAAVDCATACATCGVTRAC
jgi:xanthine dehydrogenase accessory factor